MPEPHAIDEARDGAVPEPVREGWQHAVAQWDDQARHAALLGLVAQHNCYAWAAARYRERSGDAIADKQLERLRRAATATMLASATVRPDDSKQPYRGVIAVFIVLLVGLVLGLAYTSVIHSNNDQSPATHPAAH